MIKAIAIICLVSAAVLVGCKNDDSSVSNTTTTSGNHAPYTPNTPSPTDGATGVNRFVTLSWSGGDPDQGDTTRYDVFWGTTESTSSVAVLNSLVTVFDLGLVASNTTIYWRVAAKDNHSMTTNGPVWHFRTEN
jgi:hypothetical protein